MLIHNVQLRASSFYCIPNFGVKKIADMQFPSAQEKKSDSHSAHRHSLILKKKTAPKFQVGQFFFNLKVRSCLDVFLFPKANSSPSGLSGQT